MVYACEGDMVPWVVERIKKEQSLCLINVQRHECTFVLCTHTHTHVHTERELNTYVTLYLDSLLIGTVKWYNELSTLAMKSAGITFIPNNNEVHIKSLINMYKHLSSSYNITATNENQYNICHTTSHIMYEVCICSMYSREKVGRNKVW